MSFATVFFLLPASKNRDNEMDTPVDRWDDPPARMDHFVATVKSKYQYHTRAILFWGRSLTLRIIVILSGIRNACISTLECFARVLVAQKLQLVFFKNIVILNTCRFSSSPSSVAPHTLVKHHGSSLCFPRHTHSLSPQIFTAKLCTIRQEDCLGPPEQEELLQKLLTARECETHSFF